MWHESQHHSLVQLFMKTQVSNTLRVGLSQGTLSTLCDGEHSEPDMHHLYHGKLSCHGHEELDEAMFAEDPDWQNCH